MDSKQWGTSLGLGTELMCILDMCVCACLVVYDFCVRMTKKSFFICEKFVCDLCLFLCLWVFPHKACKSSICSSPVEIVLWKQPLHLSPFIHSSVSEGNIIIRGAVKFCILLCCSFSPAHSFQPPQLSHDHALIFLFISVMCFACSSSKVGLSLISQSTPSSLWKLFGRPLMISYYCVPERLARNPFMPFSKCGMR